MDEEAITRPFVVSPSMPAEPLWLLAELVGEMNSALDLPQLHVVLARMLRWLLDFDRCTLAIHLDNTPEYLLLDVTDPTVARNWREARVPLGDGWPGRVLAEGKPCYIADVRDPAILVTLPADPSIGVCDGCRSLMLLPLTIGDRVVGSLNFSAHVPHTYTIERRTIAGVLAAHLAGQLGTIQIHQRTQDALRDVEEAREQLQRLAAQLAYQANHDPLTDLVNRRALAFQLTQAVAGVHTRGETHVLCYLDLDRFKTVNDSCGHAAGDALLRDIAMQVSECVRKTDVFARMGGDEFALLITDCTLPDAMGVIDAVYEAIKDFRFIYEDRVFSITGSLGIVPLDTRIASPEDALRAADTACYHAKHRGRDRICIHPLEF